ncbi:MAG: hypothetical protein A2046_04085 [Bacteroidetes bacterium GWA2_30_7]|nr:MAG: hypothetical protein A2046_04085 [Bacteroidetes bacterium GWA2_30_7]
MILKKYIILLLIFTLFASSSIGQTLISAYTWDGKTAPSYNFTPTAGKCYQLKVSGIFSTDLTDANAFQDAFYTFNYNTGNLVSTNNCWWTNVNPYSSLKPVPSTYNNSHIYYFYYKSCPSENVSVFSLNYSDTDFNNNFGGLTFEWYELANCDNQNFVNLGQDINICSNSNVTLDAGNAGSSYEWSTGETNQTINVNNGTYNVTVTTQGGCVDSDTIKVTISPEVDLSSTKQEPTCTNSDGEINLSSNSSNANYSIDGNNYSSNTTYSNLPEGSYSCYMIDNQTGCTDTIIVNLVDITNLDISTTSTQPSCLNNDGTIQITESNGNSPYQYSIDGGNTYSSDSIYTSLSADTYTCFVKDNDGCKNNETVILSTPDNVTITLQSSKNPTCRNNNGEITVSSNTSGSSPITYSINGGAFQSSNVFNNLPEGIYTIVAKDNDDCTDTIPVSLQKPRNIFTVSADYPKAQCNSNQELYINLTVSGGTEPNTYSWSNGQTIQDIPILSPGTYSVKIVDYNDCDTTLSYTIETGDNPVVTGTTTDVSCYGGSDGAIDISVSGGEVPYTYQWSKGESTQDISNLPKGSYTVTVTENNGCDTTATFEINQPEPINVSYTIKCNNDGTKDIDVTVSGGESGYDYIWSTNETTQDLPNVQSGTYSLKVTDSNDCDTTITVTTDEIITNYTAGGCVGSVTVALSSENGSSPYSYQWSNGQNGAVIVGVKEGTYTVTTTDSDNCKDETEVIVPEGEPCLDIPNAFTPNGDNTNDTWDITGLDDDCKVTVYNRWGTKVFHSKGYDPQWDGKYLGVKVPTATYYYEVVLGTGERYAGIVTVKH